MSESPPPFESAPSSLSEEDLALLTPAMEDYIEAIYRLCEADSACTISELAKTLEVSRPSASNAVKRLREAGFVSHRRYKKVALTPKGRLVAQKQVRLHELLLHFLVDVLQLPPELAEHDVCLMEHAISGPTAARLVAFIEWLDEAHPGGADLPAMPSGDERAATRRSWTSRV